MIYSDKQLTLLKGIGKTKANAFARLGINTIGDLINYYPRKYEDRSTVKSISEVNDGESICIEAFISEAPQLARISKYLNLTKFRVADETGTAFVTCFNQNYLKTSLKYGEYYLFYGKSEKKCNRLSFTNPVIEKLSSDMKKTGRIVPIYRLVSGLKQSDIKNAVEESLTLCSNEITDCLPEYILSEYNLSSRSEAISSIHSPASAEELSKAQNRLAFEEVFILSCCMERFKSIKRQESGLLISDDALDRFYSLLRFTPTSAQKRAICECLNDMSTGKVMNRLLQGDVGSGKTLIAAALAWCVSSCGYSTAFMAPTEILASQHFKSLSDIYYGTGMRLRLLTGSTPASERRKIREELKAGAVDIIIGTHALFSEDIEYSNLALTVTDEQHRFGVNQRASLINKNLHSHTLVMSATPIPRSMALIIYGDLDISILDEMPPGRQKVETRLIDDTYRDRLNGYIRKTVEDGHQIFVVCPKIEDDPDCELESDLKSAQEHCESLRAFFPDLSIECIHGRLKSDEKDRIMSDFFGGRINVLVATTVIEVGVDVPNATLMIIENAERFGLSQLHQLRGRVGRGSSQSWCILVSDAKGDASLSRLKALCKTADGFKIAEEDLKQRGPGEFFGNRQHGLPEIKCPSAFTDISIISSAKDAAAKLLSRDPEMLMTEHSAIKERIQSVISSASSTLN